MGTAAAIREVHDLLLANKPGDAGHRSDLCPICVEKASAATASGTPPDVSDHKSTEGGATPTMTTTQIEQQTISMDAHNALVAQEVSKAVSASDAALATQTEKASTAQARVTELETQLASVQQELSDANAKRDEDAAKVKSLTEELASLKEAADKAAAEAAQAAKATERADQVTNLKLFPKEYVDEKAAHWAGLSDEAWAEQLDSWKQLRPATSGGEGDEASAMTGGDNGASGAATTTDTAAGTGGGQETEKKPSARRAVLGLPAK